MPESKPYARRKVEGVQPTGAPGGIIHEVFEVATGRVILRTWNGNDAASNLRYFNKYGESPSQRARDHSSEHWS
jgi:hypothetical protein